MKTKFFFIYVFVGIAFLGACLWVFLTGGKNAKAVNAKYRLGGIVLTAWAILSVVSCDVPGIFGGEDGDGMVMCYDPAPMNYPIISIKTVDSQQKIDELKPGDTIHVKIEDSTMDKYLLEVRAGDGYDTTGELLQSADLIKEDKAEFDVVFSTDKEYKGPALILVREINEEDPENNNVLGLYCVTII
ncbi:MAG: hypothetical protein J6X77_00190 [Bacteroidales bacterium]|nr:hypothetical protein [Bacteroidales bacterium]